MALGLIVNCMENSLTAAASYGSTAKTATSQALGPADVAGPVSIDRIIALTAAGMNDVNRLILERAGSHVDLIPELAKHLITSGGKRLRPMLTIACAQLCGYETIRPSADGHVVLAASVEFMHTATLLHDDVVDESQLRRGRKTARMIWGNQASVLVGDYLLGQAFHMMVGVGSLECLDILSSAASVIAEGEVMQLGNINRLTTSEAEYLCVVESKTAALFAAATEVGAALSNRDSDERAALRSYGMNLGIAFQLIDDALDYSGQQALLGKAVGDDFREGKITLPVLLALSRGGADDTAFWKRTFEDNDISDGDLEHAILLMERYGTIAETLDRARLYGDQAVEALTIFPGGPVREALTEVVDFCIQRAN